MRKVLYVQYANSAAFPPLLHSSRMLADADWDVMFLAIQTPGTEALQLSPYRRIEMRQMPHCPPGWRQKVHYIRFSLWVLFWTLRWGPTWIYASDLLSCPAVLVASFLPGVRVLYHEHDSPTPLEHSRFMRMSLAARRALAQKAGICVLPNRIRREVFVREVRRPNRESLVVWNCPSSREVLAPRPAHDGARLHLLYHGTIVPMRIPETMLDAMARLPETVRLSVVGYETIDHAGYVARLRDRALSLGLGERVSFPGPMKRDALLSWCGQFDVGIAFMPNESDDINMRAMAGASNKPFDYLSCGLAVLMTDLPDWRALYVEEGCGLACDPDNPQSIAAALQWFLDHPAELREMGERGRRRIAAEWNYETQFRPVLERMILC